MSLAAALIYWVIVLLWATVLCTVVYFYIRNPRTFGTINLLLIAVGIDTLRNIFENSYFGLYFGAQYGLFPAWMAGFLGQPSLLIIPKLMNIVAGCAVLGLLLWRWLPHAAWEWTQTEQRVKDLRMLASIDPLTGVYNRRQFEILARAELARCQRYIRPMSLLMLDIDHFKSVNDRFGHKMGDWVLKAVSMVIESAKRDSDVVARIGGEEFALLLPETTKEAARAFAERVCELVSACSPCVGGENLNLTISIGVADASVRTSGIETLFRSADQALYDAKRAGRNRVAVASTATERFSVAAE
jgi:diguanylate cyclase (GGDEF)-like protein